MTKKVLIVTHSGDLHADLLTPILAAKGGVWFRIDLDTFPRDYELIHAFQPHGCHGEIRHLPSGASIAVAEVGAVWARKSADFAYRSADLGPQELAYAKMESEQALFGLLYGLDCYWVSHPQAMRGAMWKGEQLQRAQRLGFRIPATLLTNSAAQVRQFRAQLPGQMIFKAMSTPTLAAEEVAAADCVAEGLTTTLIDDEMMGAIDAVAELPCQFQQYVAKQYELRVTVIGRRVFAARIDSQDDSRTAVDCRDMSATIRYAPTLLPPQIERRCLELVASYGLNYSALDLIVTPDNEYVFLENNPAGQFLFIEQLIPEFNLLETLADQLLQEAACRTH
ncbi:ATP-grasp domain-containing protein [Duganella sp. S19_KUP01_CR8]|uniref:ATP-grasp domain-containing protein n=1 Tax=Duganella sp. S19_KUP01_CR8 TaxID=3025502 RepID=UPI002FCD7BD9